MPGRPRPSGDPAPLGANVTGKLLKAQTSPTGVSGRAQGTWHVRLSSLAGFGWTRHLRCRLEATGSRRPQPSTTGPARIRRYQAGSGKAVRDPRWWLRHGAPTADETSRQKLYTTPRFGMSGARRPSRLASRGQPRSRTRQYGCAERLCRLRTYGSRELDCSVRAVQRRRRATQHV